MTNTAPTTLDVKVEPGYHEYKILVPTWLTVTIVANTNPTHGHNGAWGIVYLEGKMIFEVTRENMAQAQAAVRKELTRRYGAIFKES